MTGPFRVACGLLLFNAIGAAGPVLAERGAEAATDPEIVQLEGQSRFATGGGSQQHHHQWWKLR